MVSLKLNFTPSSVEDKEGRLYYRVAYGKATRHIATPFTIMPDEWNATDETLAEAQSPARAKYRRTIERAMQHDTRRLRSIARTLAQSNAPTSIDAIIAEYYKQTTRHTLFSYMAQMTARYRTQGQHRTSETYSTTMNSFGRFTNGDDVNLDAIDSKLIEAYESYLRNSNLSPNTIAFYMKHLRAVYNRAVDDELITDKKPFKRISTSTEKTTKRAIPLRTIKQLKTMDCSNDASKRFARDMFLFSFYTRGMSFVDIAYLQKKNLKGNTLFYRRKKTNRQLTIQWETCMQEIVKTYSADTCSPYMFSIIKDPACNTIRQYRNALFLINRHLKQIGKGLGLHQPLTMYCARHSWASIARNEGIPLSVISEGMGHDSEKTTQIYLSSLKTEVIDKANRKILKLL